MMLKTHLALSALIALLFLSQVSNKVVFLIVVFIATLIPDIDTGFSTAGKNIFVKPLQIFVRHRGVLHSFTFCILASMAIAWFLPSISLAFFLGYGLHLFLDSFTKEGIMPFWPWKKVSSWRVVTGGRIEASLFVFLLVMDVAAVIFYIASV